MWRWGERTAPQDHQQTTGAFVLHLIFLKTARRYGGPNEGMFADAKACLSDSLRCAFKDVCRFLKRRGLFLRAAPV